MTFIILLILCLLEALFIWIKWGDIKNYQSIGKGIANATGLDRAERYSMFIRGTAWLFSKFKVLLIIPAVILFIANLIVASILGTILNFIF